ncbi:MAG TPA: CBS domain-containing protein [Thermoanaerobaculia bacterium]|jgi:CBS domain-containing membrane protein
MRALTVGEVMSRDLVTMGPGDSMAALRDRMYEHQIRHIPVVDPERYLVGLVSQRDLLRNTLMERPGGSSYVEDSILEELRVEEVMTRELEVGTPSMTLRDAARLMLDKKYGCLPVVDGQRLVGILTEADFLRVYLYED